MAYSRWSFSNWYIFWHTLERPSDKKEDQKLAVWHVSDKRFPVFSYTQLKQVQSIEDLKQLLQLDISDEDYQEALVYIRQWIKDVEEELG